MICAAACEPPDLITDGGFVAERSIGEIGLEPPLGVAADETNDSAIKHEHVDMLPVGDSP